MSIAKTARIISGIHATTRQNTWGIEIALLLVSYPIVPRPKYFSMKYPKDGFIFTIIWFQTRIKTTTATEYFQRGVLARYQQ